jgi:hypothetical protein
MNVLQNIVVLDFVHWLKYDCPNWLIILVFILIFIGGPIALSIVVTHRHPMMLLKRTNAELEGERYEKVLAKHLSKAFGVKALPNVIFSKADGEKTEVDIIFVTTKGLFCVEAKHHMNGDICNPEAVGEFNGSAWKYRKTNEVYTENVVNPIRQNKGHIDALYEMLQGVVPKTAIRNLVIQNVASCVIYEGKLYGASLNPIWYGSIPSQYPELQYFSSENYIINRSINLLKEANTEVALYDKHIWKTCMKPIVGDLNALPDVLSPREVEQLTGLLQSFVANEAERYVFACYMRDKQLRQQEEEFNRLNQ